MSLSSRPAATALTLFAAFACAHPQPAVHQLIAEGKEVQALEAVRASQGSPETDPGYALALANAAHAGNGEIVTALLDRGADPNFELGSARATPLHFALDRSTTTVYVDLTRVLLDRGADPKRTDQYGAAPLHYLASRPAHYTQSLKEAGVRLLLDRGASATSSNDERWTVLHFSAAAGDSDPLLQLLVDRGADVSAVGRAGLTPLDAAVAASQDGVAAFLMEHGAVPHVLLARPGWSLGDPQVHREFWISGRSYALYADWNRKRGDDAAAREADRIAESQLSLAVVELQRELGVVRSDTTKALRRTPGEIGATIFTASARLPAVLVAALGGEQLLDPDASAERAAPLNARAEQISLERAATQRLLDDVRARLASGAE